MPENIKKSFYKLLALLYVVILGFFSYAIFTKTWTKIDNVFLFIWIATSIIGTIYLIVFDLGMPNGSEIIIRDSSKVSINFEKLEDYIKELFARGLLAIVILLTFPFLFMIDSLME